jgi:Zn-dependent protease with chaperone function
LDFFGEQELRRRNSRWLVVWYLAALAFAAASYCLAAAALYALGARYATGSAAVPWQLYAVTAALVGGCMACVSALRMWQLSRGGEVMAELLGARYVDPEKCTPAERRLLNVVEEMAIACGVALPPVYLLDSEQAVNALVAGYSPNEAVFVVTRGALDKLSRDELQGVVGHEFSHVLNGDMVLNVRLAGLLAGLTWLGEQGEAMVLRAAKQVQGVPREKRSPDALGALFGAFLAFVGFPGTLAANAIKAAISREREFLADAASVQFTRNPEGIAGALDSILALPAHTQVAAAHAEGLAHMFFAPAVAHWWGFPTHPPLRERIRRAHPRFQREDYRARRHGRRREVAVLDGLGNVVKHVRTGPAELLASIGHPTPAHVDFGARLLAGLPPGLREALHRPQQAEAALFALGGFEAKALALKPGLGAAARSHMLALADLAVPAVKSQPQKARDRFLAEFAALVEADRRVTLREFVLLTYLRQRLRAGAGEPIPARYRRIEELARDMQVVLSLIAKVQGASGEAPTAGEVSASLERLRHLAPLQKPRVLKACIDAARRDGTINPAEAELVRMVAATLDCPVPPVLAES